MPNPTTRPAPKWPDLTQKQRVVRHLREHDEIERVEAGERYHIGRLAARILDLKKEGYVIESRKDDTGKAHYSLVSEPGETDGGAVGVDTAEALWRALPEGSLAREYVALLARCAQGEEVLGALDDTVRPEALSDWDAASLLKRDVTVRAVTGVRRELARQGLVRETGHRKGQSTYRLHPQLTAHFD